MSDEAAFLRAIRADPSDATAKLAYADGLDEHGEPERAKYLRLLANENRDPVATRELAELKPCVGSSWRMWLNTPMPAWNEATFYALGKLEALLGHYQDTCIWLAQLGYNFTACLEQRTDTVIEEHLHGWVPRNWHPVRIELLGDWKAELAGVFRKWFFGGANGNIPAPSTERAVRTEADRLSWALDCVRDVLRPLRGWRAHITPNDGWYAADWDDLVLEAADRVLFLHFSGDD